MKIKIVFGLLGVDSEMGQKSILKHLLPFLPISICIFLAVSAEIVLPMRVLCQYLLEIHLYIKSFEKAWNPT